MKNIFERAVFSLGRVRYWSVLISDGFGLATFYVAWKLLFDSNPDIAPWMVGFSLIISRAVDESFKEEGK